MEGKAGGKILKRLFKSIMILIIVLVILISILFISLKVIYDKTAKPYTGISFVQALDLYKGIKKEPKKEIFENNKISKEEEQSFNNDFMEAMMLSEESDIASIMDIFLGGGVESENNAKVKEFLEKVNFDFSKIKSSTEPIAFSLDNVGVAVLMSKVLKNIKSEQLATIEKYGIDLADDVEFLKGKIIFEETVPKMQIVCFLKLRNIINKNLEKEISQNIPGFVKNLIRKKIPENNYLLLTFYPNEKKEAEIAINNTCGNSKLQTSLNTLLDNVGMKTGTNIRMQTGEQLFNLFSKMQNEMVIQFKNRNDKNTIDIFTLQTIFKLANMTLEPGETYETLEKNFKDAIREISIQNELIAPNKYSQADLDNFIQNELVGKLGIPEESIKADQLLESISDNGNKINLRKTLESYPNSIDKFEIQDKVFAKIISDKIKSDSNSIDLSIESLEMKRSDLKQSITMYSKIDFGSIILKKMNIEESNVQFQLLKKLINGIFYEDSMLKINIDLYDSTGNSKLNKNGSGIYPLSTNFEYNKEDGNTQNRIDKIVNLVKKIKPGTTLNLNYNDICGYIDKSFKDGINNIKLSETMDFSLENGKICFPNIYEIITNTLNVKEIDKEVFRTTLTKLYNPETYNNNYVADNYTGDNDLFESEITDYQIGKLINNKFKNFENFEENNKVVMCTLIPNGNVERNNLFSMYPSYNLSADFVGKDILVLKIESSIAKYIDSSKTPEVPKKLFITILSDFKNPADKKILINNFSQAEQEAFKKINQQLGSGSALEYNNYINEMDNIYTDNLLNLKFNIGGMEFEKKISLETAFNLKANDPLSKIGSDLPSDKYLSNNLITVSENLIENLSYGKCAISTEIY